MLIITPIIVAMIVIKCSLGGHQQIHTMTNKFKIEGNLESLHALNHGSIPWTFNVSYLKPYHFASTPSPPPQMPTKQHNQKQGQKKEPRFLSLHDCHLLNHRSLTFANDVPNMSKKPGHQGSHPLRVKRGTIPRIPSDPPNGPSQWLNGWNPTVPTVPNSNMRH